MQEYVGQYYPLRANLHVHRERPQTTLQSTTAPTVSTHAALQPARNREHSSAQHAPPSVLNVAPHTSTAHTSAVRTTRNAREPLTAAAAIQHRLKSAKAGRTPSPQVFCSAAQSSRRPSSPTVPHSMLIPKTPPKKHTPCCTLLAPTTPA